RGKRLAGPRAGGPRSGETRIIVIPRALDWSRCRFQRAQSHPRPVILSEAKNLRSFSFTLSQADNQMFKSLASCFAFRCSALLNMTVGGGDRCVSLTR